MAVLVGRDRVVVDVELVAEVDVFGLYDGAPLGA